MIKVEVVNTRVQMSHPDVELPRYVCSCQDKTLALKLKAVLEGAQERIRQGIWELAQPIKPRT